MATIVHHGTTLARARAIKAQDPAILEVAVPDWIIAILLADPIGAGLARGGELRFEPGCGLDELRAEWANLVKRVIKL